ncbi:uncharacterized protein ACO6RY_13557 [Pungitius sinensis]
MYRGPGRPPPSPAAPRPTDRFPSPASGWGFPGPRSPYGGAGSCYESPLRSPVSHRGFGDGSPSGFASRSRVFGGSRRPRGASSWRPQTSSHSSQTESSVERYFSRSMLQDPWEALEPAADRQQASLDYSRKQLN